MGGIKASCSYGFAGSSSWTGLNRFKFSTNFVLGGVWIGTCCMNLITCLLSHVTVTLTSQLHFQCCFSAYHSLDMPWPRIPEEHRAVITSFSNSCTQLNVSPVLESHWTLKYGEIYFQIKESKTWSFNHTAQCPRQIPHWKSGVQQKVLELLNVHQE